MIEAYHLSKLYSRGVYALRDLTLRIDKGEFVFLTGPSGAGKSTLLRLLLRAELPSEGELKVAGHSLEDLTASQVQSYRRTVAGFLAGVKETCARYSIQSLLAPTAIPFDRLVLDYLRSRRLVG